jgi:malate dehydrogenase
MVDAILRDKKKILPCCVLAQGEYGVDNTFVGLPVILGRKGVEKIFEIKLTKKESEELKLSAAHVKELCDYIEKMPGK